MAEATVSAGYLKALLDFAVARGAPRERLLKQADVCDELLADPDTRASFESFKALMRAAKALCGDPALALTFGEESRFIDMSIVGLLSYAASTMGEAFEQVNRYGRLVVDAASGASGDRFVVSPAGESIWLEDRRPDPNAFPELTESTFARFASTYARHFPGPPLAKAVHVTHKEPSYREEYHRVFQADVTFESDRNALLVDRSWLTLKTGPPNRYVFGVFSERAEALLQSLQSAASVRGRVESLLIPILHTGEPFMPRIAASLGVSRPTLYRQLKDEGLTFEAVLNDLRRRMALHYLDGKKVSVNETAYLVGFSEASVFSRAFKRWTGASPARRERA